MLYKVDRVSGDNLSEFSEANLSYKLAPNRLGKSSIINQVVRVVEISSLEELNKFIDKYGDVVVGRVLEEVIEGPLYSIEIYDDYRE